MDHLTPDQSSRNKPPHSHPIYYEVMATVMLVCGTISIVLLSISAVFLAAWIFKLAAGLLLK